MIIEGEDFRITPVDEAAMLYDLELLYVVKPKGKEARSEFQVYGYGMPLKTCIKHVINYRIHKKHPDETISLNEFLKNYKEINLELSKWLEE